MTSDIDNQLALHRGLHTLAGPLIAMLRERLLKEKLQREVGEQLPILETALALEKIDRYCELAEKVEPELRGW